MVKEKRNIDDTFETVSKFQAAVNYAHQMSLKTGSMAFIETSKEIIDHFFPNGVGHAGYGIYQNVRVYEYGTKDEIDTKEGMQMGQRLHGDYKVDGR